jgi:hypothetical protein
MRIGIKELASILLVSASVTPAAAAPVTFAFEADVRSVTDFHNIIPGGTIHAGDVFSGTYTFESTTLDKDPVSDTGLYVDNAPPSGITFTLGGFLFGSDPAQVDSRVIVFNGLINDKYTYLSKTNRIISPLLYTTHIGFTLDDATGQAFNSDALLLTPPDLSKFTQVAGFSIQGQLLGESGFTFDINAKLIGIKEVGDTDPVPAPEPTTAMLVLTGLGVIARRGRARLRGMRAES